MTWWIRPSTHSALAAAMIVAMTDALPPPIFATEIGPLAVPTVEVTAGRALDPIGSWATYAR